MELNDLTKAIEKCEADYGRMPESIELHREDFKEAVEGHTRHTVQDAVAGVSVKTDSRVERGDIVVDTGLGLEFTYSTSNSGLY